jgi:uncharacterized membrane protein
MRDQEQETSTAESEAVGSAILEEAVVRERAADVHVIQRITRLHRSPLPDAETLSAYASLIPNGAERVMALVERQTEHRHRREHADIHQATRGHWMAFTLALALSSLGFYLGLQGHDWLAGLLFTTTIGAITAAFVVDKRPRDRS